MILLLHEHIKYNIMRVGLYVETPNFNTPFSEKHKTSPLHLEEKKLKIFSKWFARHKVLISYTYFVQLITFITLESKLFTCLQSYPPDDNSSLTITPFALAIFTL